MKYYQRKVDLQEILKRKSCFLLGPRQTGKSKLIRETLTTATVYNLLEIDTFRLLSRRPSTLREEISSDQEPVVIDEVQLLPELLNEVHNLIEERGVRFLLTGSSARKLRRKGVNLLGGRASWKTLLPFIRSELVDDFCLTRALTRGLLPSIYNSEDYQADLRDYVDLYLREEIGSETAIRQVPAYSRFLDVAALCNTQIVNYTEIGNDSQIAPTTIREYFRVLEDTLIISRLPAWRESKKRKANAKDKYYFFDIGVARYIQGKTDLVEATDDFGCAFENYIYHEICAYRSYVSNEPLFYWRTTSGLEVDFILGDHTAIEVKSATATAPKHTKGLRALMEEGTFKRFLLVSRDRRPRTVDGVRFLHYEEFLELLWSGELS